MNLLEAAASQLAEELDAKADALGRVLGPDVAGTVRTRTRAKTRSIVALMGEDSSRARRTAEGLLVVLGERSFAWWGSPLGATMLFAGLRPFGDRVRVMDASRILGRSKQRLYQLFDAGKMEHDDNYVPTEVVIERLRWQYGIREGVNA